MAYVPTPFVDRSVEFPNRKKLTAVSGQADTFDVARAEGTVFAVGTKLDAANLNAEFGKIKTETDDINSSLYKRITIKTNDVHGEALTGVTGTATIALPFVPTDYYFVPYNSVWCSIQSFTLSLSGNNITLNAVMDVTQTSNYISCSGYIFYK